MQISRQQAARGAGDWAQEPDEQRDWKKVVLIAGLGILSWVATYVGMLELIEANLGELAMVHKLIVGFSVAMLMIMIIWLLDQLFAPLPFFTKVLYAVGYVFLSLISIGFGFGFYWKVLESRGEASRSAEGAVGQVQASLLTASTRLDQLQATLVSLTAISRQKAENERSTGTSCPASRAGDGPRRKMREDDAARFEFAGNFVKGRATQVKAEIGALEADLIRITKDDRSIVDAKTGTRNEFMRSLGRKLDATVTGFNAFRTDPQLKQIRADLAERSDKSTFPDSKGGTYSCPDPQLSAALKGVVRAIDGLPDLQRPAIATVEGSEATIEAFRRLIATFHGALTFKMPPSADEQRELQKRALQSVENPQAARSAGSGEQPGLSKRDWVPLAVAIFVDLCLLLVSMGRPINRLQGLVPKMRAAERGPVIQILSRFSDIHRDPEMRESFEMLRHVVFDYAGAYYVAVPLDAPFTETRREQVVDHTSRKTRLVTRQTALSNARREELRVEAHLIANLFASFEKDSVFKRVVWLNTDSVRRRLQKQGSKFANSEAFRVYRFAEGAWSEIILGAVMGAARRAEDRRGDTDYLDRRQPSLDALADRMRLAEIEAAQERVAPQPKPVFERRRSSMPTDPLPADPDMHAQFGPYAGVVQAERQGSARRGEFGQSPHANNNTRSARLADAVDAGLAEVPAAAADNIVPFKSPQASASGQEPAFDVAADMRLPNIITRGQTAVAAQLNEPESVAASSTPSSDMPAAVTITATERKFSFELPADDARLSRGLLGIAGILKRDLPSGKAEPEQNLAFDPPTTITASVPAQPERPAALALPQPIREREARG